MEHNKSFELLQEKLADPQKLFQIRLALLFYTRIINELKATGVRTFQFLNHFDTFSNMS